MQKNHTYSLVIPRTTADSFPASTHWGIDAIKVRFPIDASISLPLAEEWEPKNGRKTKEGLQTVYYLRTFPLGKDTMQATVWEMSETCTIDFNPAHVVYGDTAQLLEPEVLELVVLQAIQATMLTPAFCEFKDDGTIEYPANWTDYINIQEMEVAFNFQVPNSLKGPMQQSLKVLRAPRNMRRAINEEAGSFTLEYSTKGVGKDSIYNKSMELERRSKVRQESEVAIFRFESRLRRKRLDKFQIRLLSDISPTSVWEALNQRFAATQWDQNIGSFGGLLKLLGEIDYRKAERLLGFSEAVRLGLDSGLELGTRRARIKEAKELGIPIGVSLDQLADSSVRIDPKVGRLVTKFTTNEKVA